MNSATNETRLAEKRYEINKRKAFITEQNESNKEVKQNGRKQKREKLIDEEIDLGRFFELTSPDKTEVNGLNLHEIESQILLEYKGDFELTGSRVIGPVERKTKNRYDFESYINAIDIDYDSEDVTFTG